MNHQIFDDSYLISHPVFAWKGRVLSFSGGENISEVAVVVFFSLFICVNDLYAADGQEITSKHGINGLHT